MANNFDSNFTRKLARVFLEKFESSRVLSKNVDTQLLKGKFNPSTGSIVDFKRPTDYITFRDPTGDLTGNDASDIITGKASGIVQDYFTAHVEYDEAAEAIEMDQIDQLLAPLATRIKTDMELDFANFMMRNTGLLAGTVGVAADSWDHIANAGAIMQASGVPMDERWYYTVNPFTQRALSTEQRSLGAGGTAGGLIRTAHERATITENFAGMDVMTATTLASYTTDTPSDRAGTITSINVTYLAAKDTMTQSVAVTAFGANLDVKAGETLQFTGINRLNLNTRQPLIDEAGANVLFTATVVADVTLGASGEGTIVVTGPAIFESGGAYNTVDVAPTTGVVTLLGDEATLIQPNMFWHKQAFSIGSVPIKKLNSTDTLATTEDGLQFRISKGVDFIQNKQLVRFDFRPAYGVMNPFFAGQGFGTV